MNFTNNDDAVETWKEAGRPAALMRTRYKRVPERICANCGAPQGYHAPQASPYVWAVFCPKPGRYAVAGTFMAVRS